MNKKITIILVGENIKFITLSALGVAILLVMAGCGPATNSTETSTEPTTTTETTTKVSTTTSEVVPSTFDDCKALLSEISTQIFGAGVEGENYFVDESGEIAFTVAYFSEILTLIEAYDIAVTFVTDYMFVVESTVGEGEFSDGTLFYGTVFLNEKQDILLDVFSCEDIDDTSTVNVIQFSARLNLGYF